MADEREAAFTVAEVAALAQPGDEHTFEGTVARKPARRRSKAKTKAKAAPRVAKAKAAVTKRRSRAATAPASPA